MNIFNNPNVQRLAKIFRLENEPKNTKVGPLGGGTQTAKSDSVNLSTEGRTFHAIRQRLAETPDVRTEKVAALRQAIESGNYRVSADDIADAMLREGKLP